ncbi:MAG: hypothetical protein M1835_007119 [Candelina submexicana]|nr:MAG: hypothetical protein M1835_007119 [Candelina submexicana]
MGSRNQGKHAIVFGASGISGWAFVNELLHDYPEPGVWSRVTALTNRPLTREEAMWPADDRLQIVSGINVLEHKQADINAALQREVKEVNTVTHIYYFAYKANMDPKQEVQDAVTMLSHSITAIDTISPALEFVVLQLGTKMYGVILPEKPSYMTLPFEESLPRIPEPHASNLFYHHQIDWLAAYSQSKSWTWCETRPDVIVGFHPVPNYYSLPTALAIYLSLYAEVYGQGAECPFPGTPKSYIAKSNDSSADIIARGTIYLSLRAETCGSGQGFNIADSSTPQNWSSKWPQICAYFSLRGTPPSSNPTSKPLPIRDFIASHADRWRQLEKEKGLRTGFAFQDDSGGRNMGGISMSVFESDRDLSLEKIRGVGFEEERGVMESWGKTFDRMREGRIIP